MKFNEQIIKKIKKYRKQEMEISIIVKNIKTKEEGVAILTQDDNIAVFEGSDDGKDDAIYLPEEFSKRHEIIRLENQYEEELQ